MSKISEFISGKTGAITGSTLIAVIVLFMGYTFYFMIDEQQTTEAEIATITQDYDALNAKIESDAGYPDVEQDENERVSRFLITKFKAQSLREQLNERTNRRYTTLSHVTEFFVILLILFLSIWAEQLSKTLRHGAADPAVTDQDSSSSQILLRLIPFFAALAIAIPAINANLGFDARQQLHDFRSIQLDFLVVELEQDMIDGDAAWVRYKSLYRQSPSSVAEFPRLD